MRRQKRLHVLLQEPQGNVLIAPRQLLDDKETNRDKVSWMGICVQAGKKKEKFFRVKKTTRTAAIVR